MSRYVPAIHIAVGLALAVALLPLPYGYYQLLRFGVCAAFAVLAFNAREDGQPGPYWVALAAVAILYNPIETVSLGREVWQVVNVLTIGALAVDLWMRRRLLANAADENDRLSKTRAAHDPNA